MTAPFPAAHSILSPQALAAQVLPAFGVGAGADVRFFQGGFNDTYRVEGANGSVYFLRVYRRGWRTREDALYELDVLDHLHRKGIPVAYPIAKPDGSLLHDVDAPEGARFAALFALAQGRELSYAEDPAPVARAYGTAVAAMHDALDDFESTHRRFQIDLDHLIGRPLSSIEPILSRRTEDWTYLRRFAGAVRLAIEELLASALERGVCHGDLQCYHANVDDAGILTFYDFDCGGFGYRAYDLAVFRWCARLQGQEDERWVPFLSAYRGVRSVIWTSPPSHSSSVRGTSGTLECTQRTHGTGDTANLTTSTTRAGSRPRARSSPTIGFPSSLSRTRRLGSRSGRCPCGSR